MFPVFNFDVSAEPVTSVGKIGARLPILSIIVPTFNERDNVCELVKRLDHCLADLNWEVVFVDDDSTDGTLTALQKVSRSDHRVRFLHRIGRRGLASAVAEGVLSTSSPMIAVMDCDFQHDESILPIMLKRLASSNCDIIVASRYMKEGGFGDWAMTRRLISRTATNLAHFIMPTKLTDPMSGFFIMKREAFDVAVRHLSNQGYKILLDILLSARPTLKVEEVPYTFRNRLHGESKLDAVATLDYLTLLLDKTVGHIIPVRFFMFLIVGGLGVVVHMALLATILGLGFSFILGQSVATIVAMTFNFFVNNVLTYRDKRLRGFWPVVGGLLSFYAVCSVGALSNVGIASVLFGQHFVWWLSGISGVLVGAVWNYAATALFTWRK